IYVRLSKSDVQEMREVLKRETRKIIKDLSEPKLKIIEVMESYLDDYIDGLSKKDTFRLYLAYLEVKEAIGFAQEKYMKLSYLTKMYQNYRKSGWSLKQAPSVKKAVKKIRTSKPVKKAVKKVVQAKKKAVAKRKSSAKKGKKTVALRINAKRKATPKPKKKAPAKKKAGRKKR
ncbi:MAG: hypothetical protein ACP5E4_02955, partial [Candidatus Aenigmatarchaeota archaeon]